MFYLLIPPMKPLGILALPSEENSILPTLHLLLWRRLDGSLAGHCLDFDLYSFCTKESDEEAVPIVLSDLITLTACHLATSSRENRLPQIYDNRFPLHIRGEDSWEAHHDSMHRLEKSALSHATESFSSLKNESETSAQKASDILIGCQGVSDSEMEEKLPDLLSSFHSCYRFRSR